jgi:hypothetical protein
MKRKNNMKNRSRLSSCLKLFLVLGILFGFIKSHVVIVSGAAADAIKFAVIGDYGSSGRNEADVSELVKGWDPDFIVTVGDNNYPAGAASTIDENVGQYFHEFIYPYTGTYGIGADTNRFFPALGNHDWDTSNAQPYLDYFTLPGNERYYDFVQGPVHFFVVDSDPREPDGITSTSIQAQWLQDALAAPTSPWNLVYMHHSPYSSGKHGSNPELQWPYAEWGADAVFSGHDHVFERIIRDGIPYFVNGLGGGSKYGFEALISGSQIRYNDDYGAMLVEANESNITFQFITRTGLLVDTYIIGDSPDEVSSENRPAYYDGLRLTRVIAHSIIVDSTSPNTFIAINFIEIKEDATISFRFIGTEPGYFLCSLDERVFTICTSPMIYQDLENGEHVFKVRAVDGWGNVDPTPAQYIWNSLQQD